MVANRPGHGKPVSEINVTPLVDVMLVLLIIFMVSAPMMKEGMKVDLPEAEARRSRPRLRTSRSRSTRTGPLISRIAHRPGQAR